MNFEDLKILFLIFKNEKKLDTGIKQKYLFGIY